MRTQSSSLPFFHLSFPPNCQLFSETCPDETKKQQAETSPDTSGGTASTSTTQQKTVVLVKTVTPQLYRLNIDSLTNTLNVQRDLPSALVKLPANPASGDWVEITVTNRYAGVPRSWQWKLEIQDIGIYTAQDASLLLIKRAKTPKGDKEVENNFKPAPGTIFSFKKTTRSRTWNFINPSLGISGSFLDFRSDKDLEVGIGPSISLFNGIIQAGVGWNLHTDSDRFYWSIGIGFLDIKEKLQKK